MTHPTKEPDEIDSVLNKLKDKHNKDMLNHTLPKDTIMVSECALKALIKRQLVEARLRGALWAVNDLHNQGAITGLVTAESRKHLYQRLAALTPQERKEDE